MGFKILEKEVLGPNVKKIIVEAPHVTRKALPGQFVIIRVNETGERIPLTIAYADKEKGHLMIIFQEVGKTTKLLGTLEVGDEIADVVGPLGRPSEIEKFGTVACLGGGIGTAILMPLIRALREKGNYVITILGFRTKDLIILEKELKEMSDEFYITTDDGSYGMKGFVTDKLKELLESGRKIDRVFSIGPVPMMKVTCDVTRPYGIKTIVSLNPIMVDGTGMCGACRVEVGGETKFVCVDGPDFDGHQVNFDLLMKRLRAYVDKEKISLELFEKERRK